MVIQLSLVAGVFAKYTPVGVIPEFPVGITVPVRSGLNIGAQSILSRVIRLSSAGDISQLRQRLLKSLVPPT